MSTEAPFVSVVVPTYRRPASLARCLEALAALDYPRDRLEVIVVDDGSDTVDPGAHRPLDGLAVTLVRAAHGGPAAARNLGATRAQGELVAFTDDDCLPSPGWLRALIAAAREGSDEAVGGRTINALPECMGAQASQFILDCVYAHYNAQAHRARFFASNNLALPLALFRELGGFDPGFPTSGGEDRDLCDRLVHQGHRLGYAHDAVVHHAHPLDLRGFWRQSFAYGRGAWRFHRESLRRGSGSVRNERGFYPLIAREALRRARSMPSARWAALIGFLFVWQAANAAGFAREALGARRRVEAS